MIARKPQRCWRAFIEVETLCAWVPGLRKVELIARAPDGMPAEVRYEFAESRTYTLAYTYEEDAIARIVRWEPLVGARDAVRGWARFEPHVDGTLMTYELEHGESRTAKERYMSSAAELVEAFARWMAESEDRRSRHDIEQ